MTLQEIVDELVQLDIEPTLTKSGWRLPGFYRHGEVTLKQNFMDGSMVIVDRYEKSHQVVCTYDVIYFNYELWKKYLRDYSQPHSIWINSMLKFSLIREEKTITYVDNVAFQPL